MPRTILAPYVSPSQLAFVTPWNVSPCQLAFVTPWNVSPGQLAFVTPWEMSLPVSWP